MSAIPQSIAYKESGIPWVGKIPEHWRICKFKYFAKVCNGKEQIEVVDENGQYLIYGSGGVIGRAKGYLYDKTSVLLGRKGTIDKPLFVEEPFWTIDTMFYTRIFEIANPRFFFYLCLNIDFDRYASGSAIPSMTQSQLEDINFPLPPLQEQQAIADFLDKKTRQIEEFITKKQKLITLLEEKKQTLINQCVTQGLDPSTPLKDSGVEWLGKIPTHWEVRKLKLLFGIGSGLGITKADFLPSGIPCVSYGEIHSKYPCRLDTGIHPLPYVSEDYLSSKPQALLKKGDFVFADTSEDIEGSGNFTSLQSDEPVFAGYHTIVLKPKTQSIHSPYFLFLFDSLGIRNQVRKEVCGVKVYSITKSILKEVQCLIPPFEEQKAIAEYLDTQIEKIDLAICKIKSQINLIKEYKTTLISEAVCGRVWVN